MEALKANKFGRTYHTGTQGSLCRIFIRAYSLWKGDIVTAVIYYYITTKFYYAKHGGVMYGENLIDILAEIVIFL